MSERKVFQKYYPPDFDPSKVPRRRRDPNEKKKNMQTVRMMLPMSIQCTVCGEYLYRGKKFNSKKETVVGEDYLGLKVFRFYIKCTRCASTITFKTDPKNSTYTAESNCTQNFDARREHDMEKAERERQKMELEGDKIKELEDITLASKTEMDILDSLDEIRTINAMNQKITPDQLLQYVQTRDANSKRAEQTEQQGGEDGDEFTAEEREKMERLFGGGDDDSDAVDGNGSDSTMRGSSSSTSLAPRRKRRKVLDAMEDIGSSIGNVDGDDDVRISGGSTFQRLEDVESAEKMRRQQQKQQQRQQKTVMEHAVVEEEEEEEGNKKEQTDNDQQPAEHDALADSVQQLPRINQRRSKAEELTLSDPTSLLVSVKQKTGSGGKNRNRKNMKSKKANNDKTVPAISALTAGGSGGNALGLMGLADYNSDSD